MLRKTYIAILIVLSCLNLYAAEQSTYKFKRLTTLNGLPSNKIHQICQGKDGYIWMASQNGFYQYDGYTFKVYKSNLFHPNLLSNDNVFCLEEDWDNNLWIGTHKGLNVLNRQTGVVEQISREEFVNNTISTILVTKGGKLLIGTDRGLYNYKYLSDSCTLIGLHNTNNVLPETAIKSILEDSYGNIWIGTWNRGLYRFDPVKNKYYSYPQMNHVNSAHVLFEDARKRIWIGTWGEGLQVLENPYDMDNLKWRSYQQSSNNPKGVLSNIIYSITEDVNSQKIWVGTSVGLSVLDDEKNGVFSNFLPGKSENTISYNEVNSLLCDSQGLIWLGLLRGGVNIVNTKNPDFKSYTLDNIKHEMNSNTISCIMIEDDKIWLGIGNSGLLIFDRHTNNIQRISEISGFSSYNRLPAITNLTKINSNGQIWIGTYNGGLYIYDKNGQQNHKVQVFTPNNTPWMPGFKVFAICEDKNLNRWIGTDYGITMLTPKFEYLRFDSLKCEGKMLGTAVVMDIKTGVDKEIWAASSNNGVYRIVGEGMNIKSYSVKNYSVSNKKLNSAIAVCVYKDKKDRIWIGTEGGGLNLYDRDNDMFVPVHLNWNLPGDEIFNILEDAQGNLWMGSNAGLIKLNIRDDLNSTSYRLYTTADGLLDNSFTRKGAFKASDGEMFFGGHNGLNSFYPAQIIEDASFKPPVVITDIKIFNHSWAELDAKVRNKISKQTPGYTKKIRLNYKNNNFSIEFAALGYDTPSQYAYAYKLDGFDSKWQYVDASRRFAYYNNLSSGIYNFKLKATNANGVWSDENAELQIVVLPPPWETWWAYLIYVIILLSVVAYVYRTMSNRLRLQHQLQLREMEKAKAEEMNHAKLQFFTNITHELLTPLTIISASVDELRRLTPQHMSLYSVMSTNINRLIRLLQQILEFRKSETGNLKLRVSHGDLSAFIINSVESFKPLIKKKLMNISVECNPSQFMAWFDPDKLDKILYNLLSNASKYNKPKGSVKVSLSIDTPNSNAVLTVSDDGLGITKDAQINLFKRFYEGDYRKYKTIGTGIGLSLTKDLVLLHRGEIFVESEEGKGTEFKVILPFNRNSYSVDEIDDTHSIDIHTEDEIEYPEDIVFEDEIVEEKKSFNLLLVEDNDDLLQLMVKLLSVDYSIFTASNGQDALGVVKAEDIDLIVSDIMMPVMDGVELCKKIKSNFESSHIPVLLLTAKTGEADRINAYDSGADSYLTKPFNLSLLHSRIKNLLKTRERTNKDFKKQLVFEAKELNYTSIDEEFLKKAIDCIHKNLSDPDYDQTRFVNDMGTTRSTLFRKMKSLTGLSYVSFIRNVRLKAACRIMEEKRSVRISELAYAVGFNDARYFSTCFKKEFGMQPREYYDKYVQSKGGADGALIDDLNPEV
ncbi:hybrid sensor histidine kinase/response regulator transcription factor [Paludibacter sp.]